MDSCKVAAGFEKLNQQHEAEEKDKRLKEKVVWLLGAGFSCPLGGPLFSDLFSPGTASWVQGWLLDNSLGKDSLQQALSHYKNGFDLHLWKDAEECLAVLHEAETDTSCRLRLGPLFGSDISLEQDRGKQQVLNARAILSAHVAIATCHYVSDSRSATERWHPYEGWMGCLTENDTIVSFNYDRVVERLLTRKEQKIAGPIKLHGTVPDHTTLVQRVKESQPIEEIRTPGPAKLASSKGANWEGAARALEAADRLVVVGYSFPASDSFARNFILKHCNAKVITIVLGRSGDGAGDLVASMFHRFGAQPIDTKLYAQEFLAEGSAKPHDGRFRHFPSHVYRSPPAKKAEPSD